MEYSLLDEKLNSEHKYGTCQKIRGANGETLVAIASGISAGLETWNSEARTVTNISPDFPPLSGDFKSPKMLAIKGGAELIYYATGSGEVEKPIYKYFVANNTWIEVGEMLFGRDDFMALPVRDISC